MEGNERIVASEDSNIRLGIGSSPILLLRRASTIDTNGADHFYLLIFVHFQSLSVVRPGYVCSSGNATPGEETSLHKRSTITDLIMINRRRVYRG